MKTTLSNAPHKYQRALIVVAVVFAIASGVAGLWSKSGSAGGNVFAALPTIGARPLAPGELHVDYIPGDPFGHTDTVTPRVLVARAYSKDPRRLIVIDSREAKICKSTSCANCFSGGQQQRVAIARALANNPELLLDESTGNLDSAAEADVLDLLAELHNQGRTLLMVTHNPDVADRDGRVVLIKDVRVFSGAEQVSIHA